MLSCKGGYHHIHLRQSATAASQLQVNSSINAAGFTIERPETHMPQELIQAATILFRMGGLLDADFKFAEHGIARDEPMPRPATL